MLRSCPLDFKRGLHVSHAERVLRMDDDLPELRDFPKEFGGSGGLMK